jgi:hypothetical protein
MVYRPGDREATKAFFEAMGCAVSELPGFPWLVINIDPGRPGLSSDNAMYANESTPAQQNLERALEQRLAADSELAELVERYRGIRRAHPQYVHHFGASTATHEDWAQRVENLQEANRSHPLLKGRIEMYVYEPGVPGALGPLSQAFIHTDIIQVAPLQMGGLLFDLQWAPPLDFANAASIEFPDRLAMV